MRTFPTKQTVLVPIIGGDVSDETLSVAKSLLAAHDARLVVLYVTPAFEGGAQPETWRADAPSEPRWCRLASTTAPNRTFVEAVMGDPATEILAQAERFHSDAIVMGRPTRAGTAGACVDRAIAEVVRAAPRKVYITNRRARPARTTRLSNPRARKPSDYARSHAAESHVRVAAEQAAHR